MAPHRLILSSLIGSLLLADPAAAQSPAPVARFEYDAEGRPTRSVLAPQSLALVDEFRYDSLARLIQHLDPSRGSTDLAYLGGQAGLRSVTDPRRLVTSYGLDGFNQRRSTASPDRGAETQAFDAAGNALGGDDARYLRTIRSHDALDRLISIQFQQPQFWVEPMPPNMAYNTIETHRFLYDQVGPDHGHGIGRLTTQTTSTSETRYAYDAWGRISRTKQVVTHLGRSHVATVNYYYDAAGGLTGMSYPSGRMLELRWEGGLPRHLLFSLTPNAEVSPVIDSIEWVPWSKLRQDLQWQAWTWSSNGVRHERRFDDWGRIERLQLGPWRRELRYDDADRIVAYQHNDPQGQPVKSLDQRFEYDANSRLRFASNGLKQWTYSYDANGNRVASNGSAGPRDVIIDGASNRISRITNPTANWAHDTQGNARVMPPLTGYYDVAGQLSRMDGSSSTEYRYGADRRRVLKATSAGSFTVFVHGLRGELLGEYDLRTGHAIREYLWLGDTPVALVGQAPGAPAAEVFAIHTDHLDTPRVLTDSVGRLRWTWLAEPFGNEAANQLPTPGLGAINLPLRMPGQYQDPESGLFYNHHRYYDPRVGRYTQSDPIGLQGGINTYAYAEGNPVSYVDPEGLRGTGGATFQVPTTMLRQTTLPGFSTPVLSPGPQPIPSFFAPSNPFVGRQTGAQLIADSIGNIDFRTPSNVNWGNPLPRPPVPQECTVICIPDKVNECSADSGCKVVCGAVVGPGRR